ncbi:hypothetical protein EV361DRAFT_399772 [Lentinula raphanica]|nr:hypothetical protein EV361DRAFT_399772 [Lentinula raphanica]
MIRDHQYDGLFLKDTKCLTTTSGGSSLLHQNSVNFWVRYQMMNHYSDTTREMYCHGDGMSFGDVRMLLALCIQLLSMIYCSYFYYRVNPRPDVMFWESPYSPIRHHGQLLVYFVMNIPTEFQFLDEQKDNFVEKAIQTLGLPEDKLKDLKWHYARD